jgi:uncharacterized protein (DUF1786 family)
VGLACTSDIHYYITRIEKHPGTAGHCKERIMNTRIASKVAALALALLINGTVFGGVAVLFSAERAAAAGITLVAA